MKKRRFGITSAVPSELIFYGMIVVIGIVIFVAAIAVGRSQCVERVRKTFNITVKHLESQCREYDNFLDSDEAKSLFHINEQTDDIGRTLSILPEESKDEWLNNYMLTQRLSCIIITDENLESTAKYVSEEMKNVRFENYIPYKAVQPIIEYPLKIYSSRIEKNGMVFDMAAAARHDKTGVVICFRLQNEENMNNYYSSVQRLLAGDKNMLDGTIVITKGNSVISSNRNNIIGAVGEIEEITMLDRRAKPGGIVKISNGKNVYYGGKSVFKEYGIYVYYPAENVFSDSLNIAVLALCVYFIIIFFMVTYHQSSRHRHAIAINEQYEIIRTISTMFLFNIFVDIKRNKFNFLIKTADFENIDEARPADEVLKTDFADYAAEPYRESYREFADLDTLKRRLAGKVYIEIEYQNIHGEWMNDIIIPKRNAKNGDFDSFLLVTKNINEQKQLEIEYQSRLEKAIKSEMRANEAKTDLLRRMSHDLRTPINAILGMIEIADRNADDAKKLKYCRNQARMAAEYLLELVNDILTINRLEFDDNAEMENVFDLRDEADKIYTMIKLRAADAGVTLNPPKVTNGGGMLSGNILYFHQIVINIVTNAVKYSNKGGTVSFSLEEYPSGDCENDAFVHFVCEDNGIGMSREFQQKMFEPFEQENKEEVSAYGGLGLGLAIVKKLVEKLGGTLSVQSEKGVGTRFEITLPFKYSKEPIKPENEDTTYSISGLKLLIAEDNAINMEIAEYLAEDAGAEVVKAFDGKEAVEKFAASEEDEFDVILMDITMPGTDGLEATKRIRALSRADAKTVPIIAMTANLFIQDIEKCMSVGMNSYLPKPINPEQFVKAVSEQSKKRLNEESIQ